MIRLALLFGLLAQPAAALSCLRPDVAASFARAHGADAVYLMARGTVSLLPGQVVRPGVSAEPVEDYALRGVFDGAAAGADGFDRPLRTDVTVEIGCAGPWCGRPPTGEVVAFLERREDALVLREGPCPRDTFPATDAVVERALSCLRGGDCAPADADDGGPPEGPRRRDEGGRPPE